MNKKDKYPTVTIRTKDNSRPPIGANVEVLLNGEKVPFCYAASFHAHAHARGISKIKLELYGYGEVEAMGSLYQKILPLKGKKTKGARHGREA